MPKVVAATSSTTPTFSHHSSLSWRPTKIMNMRDLSKDDDFLSHLLVEKLGTGNVPLYVHKMDSSRKLPKTDANDLLQIVRRLVMNKAPLHHANKQAVDELLMLPSVRYYLKPYEQKQTNAFATHASRYFELYHPSGSIEIAHTSRYAYRTGKSELCILATRNLVPGMVITELKGSMANLTDEEDRELKRNLNNSDVRRDFSVIHSKQMKKNHLFLGPARFVNHDCDNNCELFREGKYITFRVIRPILVGEEITAHYGDGYFGKKNRHCLCETCEKNGRGGYAPDYNENEPEPNSSSDSDTDSMSSLSDSDTELPNINVDERRTRRGVYAVVAKGKGRGNDDSDEDADEIAIELAAEVDVGSTAPGTPPDSDGKIVPPTSTEEIARSLSALTSLSSDAADRSTTPFRSIIATRRQKAKEGASPPSTEQSSSLRTPTRKSTRTSSIMHSLEKDKGREKTGTPVATPASRRSNSEAKVKKEEAEPRNLRVRQPVAQPAPNSVKPRPAREVPRGEDGKPLPLCVTCSNVLPLISIDAKVVWGLMENTPKKKKPKQECPRCMRHSAIYAQPWPSRLPPNGHSPSFLPTPREESTPADNSARRVTHKVLPVIDRKLQQAAAAAVSRHSGKASRKRRNESLDDERPEKRAKLGSVQGSPSKSNSGRSDDSPESVDTSPNAPKRKRGRPRIHFPEAKRVKIKEEETPLPLSDKQPRIPNGQFGPKGAKVDQTLPSLRHKKRLVDIEEEHPRKRSLRGHGSDDQDIVEVLEDVPLQKVVPKPTNFRSTCLLSKPNPLSFARQAWGGPVVVDDSSSSDEDDKGVTTPEDDLSPPAATIVNPDDILPRTSPSPGYVMTLAAARGALTYKPSPITFAKRRWASVSSDSPSQTRESPLESGTDSDQAQTDSSSDLCSSYCKPDEPMDELRDEVDDLSRIGEEYAHHFHPPTTRDSKITSQLHKSVNFPLPDSTPSFILAGWDSSSELSDC